MVALDAPRSFGPLPWDRHYTLPSLIKRWRTITCIDWALNTEDTVKQRVIARKPIPFPLKSYLTTCRRLERSLTISSLPKKSRVGFWAPRSLHVAPVKVTDIDSAAMIVVTVAVPATTAILVDSLTPKSLKMHRRLPNKLSSMKWANCVICRTMWRRRGSRHEERPARS